MILLDEEKFQERSNREKSLQQVIKQQEGRIKDLEEKLEIKSEHILIPQKLKYEAEILKKHKEIDSKRLEVSELEKEIEELRAVLKENAREIDNLKLANSKEKATTEKQKRILEEGFTKQKSSLIYENKLLSDQISQLRGLLNQNLAESQQFKKNEEQIFSCIADLMSRLKVEEEKFLAENIRYKREVEKVRKQLQDQAKLSNQEKLSLQKKYHEAIELNKRLEADVQLELETFRNQFREFQKEAMVRTKEIENVKRERDELLAASEAEKSELEKLVKKLREDMQQISRKNEEFLESKLNLISGEMTLINQEKTTELEKYIREIDILKQEKSNLQRHLEQLSEIFDQKEASLLQDFSRQKLCLERLLEMGRLREEKQQEEIRDLEASVLKLQRSFLAREDLIKNEKQIDTSYEQTLIDVTDKLQKLFEKALSRGSDKKTTDLVKENKTLLSKLTDKITENEKLRTILNEKKIDDKKTIQQNIEKISFVIDELGAKVEGLGNLLSSILRADQASDVKMIRGITDETMNLVKYEMEIVKYEERLLKTEADLDMAKRNLIISINRQKDLEAKLNSRQQFSSGYSNGSLFGSPLKGASDKNEHETERLASENASLIDSKKKMEEYLSNRISNLESELCRKVDDIMEIVKNSTNSINSVVNSQEKTIKPNSQGSSFNSTQKFGGPSSGMNSAGGGKFVELKKQCKGIIDTVAVLQKSLNGLGNTNLENEFCKALKGETKDLQERMFSMSQVHESDINFIKAKLNKYDEIDESSVLRGERALSELRQCCEKLMVAKLKFDREEENRNEIWRDFENRLQATNNKLSELPQSFYDTEQQTITILRTEAAALEQRLQEEKDRGKKEIELFQQTMKKNYALLERKLDSALAEVENLKKREKDFTDYLEKIKIEHSKELKKLKAEATATSKKSNETQIKYTDERKKYNEKITKLEALLIQKEEEHKKLLNSRINKLASVLEDKSKIINSIANQQREDEKYRLKIEEEKDRQYIEEIQQLTQEIMDLKEWHEDREESFIRERDQFSEIINKIRINMESSKRDAIYHQSQVQILESQLEEKENQYGQEIMILKAQLQNKL